MLLEDPKHPFNPDAKVNPERKQRNLLSPEDKKHIKWLKKERFKARLGAVSHFAGNQAAAMYVTPVITRAAITRDITRDVAKREKKLNKQRIQEASAKLSKQGVWNNVKGHYQKASQGVEKGLGKYAGWVKDHPIKAGGLAIAGNVAFQSAVNIGSHYTAHRAKMKDPMYAAQSYHLARERKNRTGAFTPLDQDPIMPSHADYEQQKAQQQKQQTPKDPVATEPENARPGSKVSQQASQGGHGKEHAHMAVTRGMAMDKVNTAGKNFKLNQTTKTNTRKEDCMAVDVVMEMVDDLEEFDIAGSINKVADAAKKFAPEARKAAGNLGGELKKTWGRAKPHLQKAWGDTKQAWKRRQMKGPVGENFRKNKQKSAWGHVKNAYSAARGKSVAEHVIEEAGGIYEWASAVAAAVRPAISAVGKYVGKGAIKKAATSAAIDGGISFGMTKVQNALNKKNEDILASDVVVDTADRIYEVGTRLAAKVFARKAVRSGVEGIGSGVGSMVGARLASVGQKKPQYEETAYGAKSEYEINPAKNWKAARALKTNNWVDTVSTSMKTHPKNFNKPRHSANPQMKYESRHDRINRIIESSVANKPESFGSQVDKVGAKVATHVGAALKSGAKKVGKAAGSYYNWMETGSFKGRAAKYAGTAAAVYGAHKLLQSRRTNRKYQQAKAEKHREGYNKAASNLDYANARDDFHQRRQRHYRGY